MATRHCPECGFVNPEGANYCARCGAFLGAPAPAAGAPGGGGAEHTATYRVGETGEFEPFDPASAVAETGAALVIRSGGGRVGETFTLTGDRLVIGRSPDADIFLDDITVSRDHALLVHRHDAWHLDDHGSLNGTYVNRRRIDSVRLSDGDELQVGKYKLAFLGR